ncbi:MAG: hypothetical protein JWO36_3193 [Myxococcales bacterium]|nr:hypothetical protein [Myxococcales bacterium]
MIQRLAVLAFLLLGGCNLYWNNGSGDDCTTYGAPGAVQGLRDPETGQCQSVGGGGNCGCGVPCPALNTLPAQPNWAACFGMCEERDEGSCLATAACHAAYVANPIDAGGRRFLGCFEVAPTTSDHPNPACAAQDAQGCSERDDCVTNYNTATQTAGSQKFLSCADEALALCTADAQCGSDQRCDTTTCHARPCPICPTCGQCAPDDTCYGVCVSSNPSSCAAIDCGPGSHCQQQCSPCDQPAPNGCMDQCAAMCLPDTTCATVDCGAGYVCEDQCTGPANGQPGTCAPQCVPTNHDPGSCTGTITCATPRPACPVGSSAGIANGCYTGYCIPNEDCGPNDPGECYGPVSCLTGEPSCPSGTVAGIKNGCWTGYCIPQNACPPQPCDTLATEAGCKLRNDCVPVYNGMNCICYPDHCECTSETYARCEAVAL